jgi:hypothetical protein
VNGFGAAALIIVGVALASTETLQATSGRYIGFRNLTTDPSAEKIRLGGLVGADLDLVALLLAASLLTPGLRSITLAASSWAVVLGGGLWLWLRLRHFNGH